MAIDRIGKGGALPPSALPAAPEGGATTGAQAPFKVDRAEPVVVDPARGVDATQGASPLARLRSGEIDVNGYVDLKVEDATKNLHGLPASDLAEIKNVLRDQLRTDPGLADLVRSAAGTMPTPPED